MHSKINIPYIDNHAHESSIFSTSFYRIQSFHVGEYVQINTPHTLGLHPMFLKEVTLEADLRTLERQAQQKEVIAIGECGIDKRKSENLNLQIEVFLRQVELASLLQKPLIIHCVRAYQEIVSILDGTFDQSSPPVIFHGFAKNYQLAKQLIDKGYYLSLGPQVLNDNHQEMVKNIPIDSIFLETDSNIEAIEEIYFYLCVIRKMDMPELKRAILKNFNTVYKLP
ncbi:MAG TPA: TatD family hydrolase [Candidatus Sphingobacterium stercoripullorum]|uniref:TatD family hydrolase n=1 Tax=Candidatus Sphingobacterium stercoripullorum TaxID=2838759 RepID=A0A9D2AY29_9SPHI|nr:TatD family hydrolase [Candidatus Sphingobacterium stercoripullorum]HLR50788.1 TatD family hydrolase [Candidatus Sphingobacterium stercoripullorum]